MKEEINVTPEDVVEANAAFPLVISKPGTPAFDLESEDAALEQEDKTNVLTE